jgi:hypothetical protein
MQLMPVCSEKTFMDYLSQVCMLFGCLSLVETGVVLFLFHQKAQDWSDLVSAGRITKLLRRLVCCKRQQEDALETMTLTQSDVSMSQLDMSDDLALRLTMYQQIFFVLDTDYGGSLDVDEISVFGEYTLGEEWSTDIAVDFMQQIDTNNDGVLEIEEFVHFCEEKIYKGKGLDFIQQRAQVSRTPS